MSDKEKDAKERPKQRVEEGEAASERSNVSEMVKDSDVDSLLSVLDKSQLQPPPADYCQRCGKEFASSATRKSHETRTKGQCVENPSRVERQRKLEKLWKEIEKRDDGSGKARERKEAEETQRKKVPATRRNSSSLAGRRRQVSDNIRRRVRVRRRERRSRQKMKRWSWWWKKVVRADGMTDKERWKRKRGCTRN
jgi:hypothetical protein